MALFGMGKSVGKQGVGRKLLVFQKRKSKSEEMTCFDDVTLKIRDAYEMRIETRYGSCRNIPDKGGHAGERWW